MDKESGLFAVVRQPKTAAGEGLASGLILLTPTLGLYVVMILVGLVLPIAAVVGYHTHRQIR